MSCTDDKTPCPCEPGLEVNDPRRFEAADLKAAVLDSEDENENASDSWYMLEAGKTVPNEVYDAALDAESTRLYEAWRTSTNNRGWNGDSDEYKAHQKFRALHGNKLYQTKQVPWTFTWNGKTLEVKVVQDNGGTEGGGEQAHMIYQVCDRLFRLDGSYYSYDGTTWDSDSFREVKAVTKAVVFYE